MNNSEYILRTLEKQGVEYLFMVPGKLINPLMSCYSKNSKKSLNIRPIVAAHEGGAAAMADGYARASQKIGVCAAIDGPGITNTTSMICTAQADASSVLLIGGHIPKGFHCMGSIQDTTQNALDTSFMFKPICKKSFSIMAGETLPKYFKLAIREILSPQKGTAFLSIAKDIFLEDVLENENLPEYKNYSSPKIIDFSALKLLGPKLKNTNGKILLLVGNRYKSMEFYKQLKYISEKYDILVATTISSKGMFDEDHPNFLGLFGYSGHKRAHDTILNHKIEMIFLIGFEATQWTTLAWHERFINHPNLIQVDHDPNYISKNIDVDFGITSHEEVFLREFEKEYEAFLTSTKMNRTNLLGVLKKIGLHDETPCATISNKIHPGFIVRIARNVFSPDSIAIADAGVHRSHATHYWTTHGYGQFFAATSFAPMGWAVPASIGVSLANNNLKKVIVFTGDGCMLMSALEIQTAVKHNLDITYVVFNNSRYGASYFNNIDNEDYLTEIPQNNWSLFAESIGAKGYRVTNEEELYESFQKAYLEPGPKVLDIFCDHEVRAPARIYAETLRKRKHM